MRRADIRMLDLRPSPEVVAPFSEDFFIGGGRETVERARKWAIDNHYTLVRGVPKCPHGLVGVTICAGKCHGILDHANIWVGDPRIRATYAVPFILAHNYGSRPIEKTQQFADAWNLQLDSYPTDGWYHPSAQPIRLTPADANIETWPLERDLLLMLTLLPVAWPDDED